MYGGFVLLDNPLVVAATLVAHILQNCFLQANPPVEVSDLLKEIKDGQILLTLVEVLLGIEVSREKKNNRISYIKNVQEAMRLLARNKVNGTPLIRPHSHQNLAI